MRPLESCSAAASAAPAPFDTLDAITMVFVEVSVRRCLLPSFARAPNFSLSTKYASWMDCSVLVPQSFSGFFCEWACLKAKRLG
jgi:hypothetical protein